MTFATGFSTLSARLASFETTVALPKRRGSNAKGAKTIHWPHHSPSSTELAEAGFYYKPSAASHDNTICFLCDRALDGWEEDDDPISEHLKHSSKCGWAIIQSIARNSDAVMIDDPRGVRLVEARRYTFALGWPHDGKRGWTCKSEKMVEAGWHFAPTAESEDFVSCAYCKLSLDGWEPKDDPFKEHHRRSPECPFFAAATLPKTKKGNRGRPSKPSRVSTQSNATATSEAPSIPDLNDSIDISTLSQDTVLSTASTLSNLGNKNKGRGRKRGTRAKKVEPKNTRPMQDAQRQERSRKEDIWHDESMLEKPLPAVPNEEEPVATAETATSTWDCALHPQAAKAARGTKRTSNQISEDDRGARESTVRPASMSKKRKTDSQSNTTEKVEYPTLQAQTDILDIGVPPEVAGPSKSKHVEIVVPQRTTVRSPPSTPAQHGEQIQQPQQRRVTRRPSQTMENGGEQPSPRTKGEQKRKQTQFEIQIPQKCTTPSPSPQSSDAENAPPSSRPASLRPPLEPLSMVEDQRESENRDKWPTLTPSRQWGRPVIKQSAKKLGGGLQSDLPWSNVDIEAIFNPQSPSNIPGAFPGNAPTWHGPPELTSPEKKMTVEEWINWNAGLAEEELKQEAERMVGIFEREGGRAMRALEGIRV